MVFLAPVNAMIINTHSIALSVFFTLFLLLPSSV